MSELALRRAVRVLRAGGIVAVPTEAVWGFSCDPYNRGAVETLLRLKERDWRKGLIVVASELDHLAGLIESPSTMALKRARALALEQILDWQLEQRDEQDYFDWKPAR